MAGLTFDLGGCPPGYYRPSALYDCRPQTSGQTYLQTDLQRIATQYVDDGSTGGTSTASQSTVSAPPYQMPVVGASLPVAQASGGIDPTMLLMIGAVILIVMMKK
jgi:hypothetical protein